MTDLCCFCKTAVPWDKAVKAPWRGKLRLAHASCCINLRGSRLAQMTRNDRNRVLAVCWPTLNPKALGLGPRKKGHVND